MVHYYKITGFTLRVLAQLLLLSRAVGQWWLVGCSLIPNGCFEDHCHYVLFNRIVRFDFLLPKGTIDQGKLLR